MLMASPGKKVSRLDITKWWVSGVSTATGGAGLIK
jgi:hypothetical protein